MIGGTMIRIATLVGGMAVSKAIDKIIPTSLAGFKADPLAEIGGAIIKAAAADAVMGYIENRIVGALDSIAAVQEITDGEIFVEEEPAKPAPAPAPAQPRKPKRAQS